MNILKENKYWILGGLVALLAVGIGSFIEQNSAVGGLPPIQSVQLASNPQADYILQTDGNSNSWVVNSGGGAGLHVDGGGFVYPQTGDYHSAPKYVATSTDASTFVTLTVSGVLTGDLTGNADTATALLANGANCNAGEYPLGIDTAGAVESCTDATTEIDSAILTHKGDSEAHQALVTLLGENYLSLSGQAITANAVDLSGTNVTGTLDVPNGGTGATTLSGVLYGNGTSAVTATTSLSQEYIDPVGFADFDTDVSDLMGLANAIALDSPAVTVTSNGTTVTLNLEKSGTGDIRFVFSDGVYTFDATPIATIALTAGSDISPQINYIYVLQSDKTLTVSTSAFPDAEYAPIATVLVQSAATAQTDGVMKMHAWTDHASKSNGQGHLADINYWIRQQPATWQSGTALSTSVGAGTFDIAVSSGVVLQLHDHAYPAFDTSAGSEVYVVNDPTTAYLKAQDFTQTYISQDVNGTVLGNAATDFYNLVVWGVISEAGSDSKLMVNLPDGAYGNDNGGKAQNDDNNTAIYSIPSEYTGTGFLIARLTVRENGGTYSIIQNEDLRGKFPSTVAGGGSTGGNEFIDNVFLVLDDLDITKQLAFQVSGVTTATTRTLTVPDASGTIALTSDLHNAVTLAGESYLSLSTQQITAGAIGPTHLDVLDFGDFTCNGTSCSLDTNSVADNEIDYSTITLDVANTITAPSFVGDTSATSTLAGGLDISAGCFAIAGVCIGGGSAFSTFDTDYGAETVTSTWTLNNVLDAGGATSLEIPNGASPTVDATGEIALDTTSDQLLLYGASSKNVFIADRYLGFSYATTTAWTGTTTQTFGFMPINMTIQEYRNCSTDTGTLDMLITDGTNEATMISLTSSTSTVTISTNGSFEDGEELQVVIGNPASTPTSVTCWLPTLIDAD